MAAVANEQSADAPDRTISRVAWAVAAFTLVFAAIGAYLGGLRFGVSTLVGGGIAAANFLVLARVIQALTGKSGQAAFWGAIYLFKIVALFGGVWLLYYSGAVSLIGFTIGFTALVPGIVVGGLVATPKDPTENADR